MNEVIENKTIYIFNILRSLGLNTSLKGTKLLNKAIQIVLLNDDEFIIIKNVYLILAKKYNLSPKQIENYISYAIDSRQIEKTEKNFEKIFNYEYDEFIFTNKIFIDEITRIIKNIY